MRKKVMLLICIVFIAIAVIIIFESYYDISRTYTINQNDSGYEVVIRKYNGEIILDEEIEVVPVIKVVGKNTLTLALLAGNYSEEIRFEKIYKNNFNSNSYNRSFGLYDICYYCSI